MTGIPLPPQAMPPLTPEMLARLNQLEEPDNLSMPMDGPQFTDDDFSDVGGDESLSVIETEDGGADILDLDDLGEEALEQQLAGVAFDANLVEVLPPEKLDPLVSKLVELVDTDKMSREKRDKQQEEGLKRSGLGDDAPGGADFPGASRVVHPILAECTVDFASTMIRELFPPEGPAKMHIPGTMDPARLEKADRKSKHMNWQLREECPEFRPELEQFLTQLPMGGSQYFKFWWDKRLRCEFVPIDDLFLPASAQNFWSANRYTHRYYLTGEDVDRRVMAKQWVEGPGPAQPDVSRSSSADANDKIEGVEADPDNEDEQQEFYEIYFSADIGEGLAPYILTVDSEGLQARSLVRNWDPEDQDREACYYIAESPFIPWRGALGIGFPHMIGSLSGSMTGALRAILDSAHLQNSATGLKLKGNRIGGQNTDVKPGSIGEIEGETATVDPDIRKLFLPMMFQGPSPVLAEILGFLDKQARGVVRTTMDDSAIDTNANVPVGTQLSRVEQGMKVLGAIHERLHSFMARCLAIVHRLNKMYLDDQAQLRKVGEVLASRGDYQGPVDVIPVSDPRIFSDMQRTAQAQSLLGLAAQAPELYNKVAIHQRVLRTLKIPNPEEILQTPQQPMPLDPASELMAVMMGKPVMAFPEQNHIAYLQVYVALLNSPLYGANPAVAPQLVGSLLPLVTQRLVMIFAESLAEGLPLDQLQQNPQMAQQAGPQIAQLMGQRAQQLAPALDKRLGTIPTTVLQAMELVQKLQQKFQPPLPGDPNGPLNRDISRQAMMDAAKVEDMAEEREFKKNKAQLDATVELLKNQDDNETELEKEEMRLEARRQADSSKVDPEDARQAARAALRHS